MQVHLLKSKIHRATVTDSSLNYEGSMTIAADYMEQMRYYEESDRINEMEMWGPAGRPNCRMYAQ